MAEWMLWGRFGGSIQLGSAPPPRLYLIPLSSSIEHEGPLAFGMGHQNRDMRTLEGVTRALDRAVSGGFDGVIFPSDILLRDDRGEIYSRCQSRGLKIVHQVTCEALHTEVAPGFRFSLNDYASTPEADPSIARIDELLRRLDAGDALNLVFGAKSPLKETLLARLTRWPDQVYFTYSVRKHDPVLDILHNLQPFLRERLFFHFPYHLEFGDGHLSCREVYDLTARIHSRVPGIKVRPMLGTENFDPRVDPELELEPTHGPKFQLKTGAAASKRPALQSLNFQHEISVIIPSYNNRDYLLNTIKHLIRQDLPREQFEVVVVDDGSNDGSEAAVKELVQSLDGNFNFKYIYSPRSQPRKMGDANYRAGISRNLGVKNANGRIFCFLDSDILTPRNFLADLLEKHKRYDVIQCKRLNLTREKSNADICFADIHAENDTFFTEGGYWEHFYSLKDWSKEPFFWKYTCTYGLSIPATLFKRIGWIRRGFVFYGFEDVELGYRLAKVGSRFLLNDMVTYHLFHRAERSEFHNSDYLRQILLAKTAQIFYLGRLEPEIYTHFRGLMKEQLPLSSLLKAAARNLGLVEIENSVSKWMAARPDTEKTMRATFIWFMIPFVAVWNWRWFLWKLIQAGKRRPYLKPLVVVLESMLRGMEAAVEGKTLPPIISRLGLWRIRTHLEALIGQTWRITVPARRLADRLQLWRITLPAKWVSSRIWKVKVPFVRTYGAITKQIATIPFWRAREVLKSSFARLWWVRVLVERVSGQVSLAIAKLQLWRLIVIVEKILSERWRLKVFADRLRSEMWRLSVLRTRLHVTWWKTVGLVKHGLGWIYGRGLETRTALTTVVLPTALSVLQKLSYPLRKIYYFSKYQYDSRIAARKKEESALAPEPASGGEDTP